MRIGDTAASAMNAFGVDMMARANNIANVNTPGFKASSVTFSTGPQGQGVHVASINRDASQGPMVPGYAADGRGAVSEPGYVEGSNTDLAREFTGMMATEHAYSANAAVIRTHDDLTGTLLDMMA